MAEPASSSFPDLRVKLGDTVILDVNGDKQMFITVRPNSKVKLGGSQVPLKPVVGCLYGSLFSLSADGERLVKKQHTPSPEWGAPTDVTKNNANLMDAGTANQQLSAEDIAAMKAAGKSGDDIVSALAASSATFGAKSEFSQEKYKKKKAKKYIFNVVVRRPTAAAICQAYYAKHPGKMRLDALSLLLSLANVGAYARVLVLETCGGLITGAVAERLGGYGSVMAAYVGPRPPSAEALQQFSLSKEARGAIHTAPFQHLLAQAEAAAANGTAAAGEQQEQQPAQKQQHVAQGGGAAAAVAAAEAGPAAVGEPGQTDAMQEDAPAQNGQAVAGGEGDGEAGAPAAVPAAAAPVPWQPFTSCIIAAPALSPGAALASALPLLAPSAAFAVHCQWAQPLAEAMAELQAARLAVGLMLQESWWREHQVLPARTHPTMNMNHGGGYLLSGTVVSAEEQGGGQTGRKRKA